MRNIITIIVILACLTFTSAIRARGLKDFGELFLTWTIAEKIQLMNHEKGHNNCVHGSKITLNWSFFRSSGITRYKKNLSGKEAIDAAKAGMEASGKFFLNSMTRLDSASHDMDPQTRRIVAATGLICIMDFPMYTMFGKSSLDPVSGSNINDIENLKTDLHKSQSSMNKKAIAVIALNYQNIRDLFRTVIGKPYKKRDRRIYSTCDGETFKVGMTTRF